MTQLADRLREPDAIETTSVTVRDEPAGVVSLAADIQTIVASFKQYQAAVEALLEPDDYQPIGNKQFKKKSAWRKLAKAFGLTTSITGHGYDDADELYWFTVRATDPRTGRYAEAWGGCSLDERTFSHRQDIQATAHTRATNRAISDLIGAGEVSAEEASDEQRETTPQRPVQPRQPSKAPQTAPTPDAGCPAHGTARLKDGQYGLYCATKLEDGTWCKWKPGNRQTPA